MKLLILVLAGLMGNAFAQVPGESENVSNQENLQINLGARKSVMDENIQGAGSVSYLFSLNKDGSLKIGPKVEAALSDKKWNTLKPDGYTITNGQGTGSVETKMTHSVGMSQYAELTVGPQIEKSLSLGKYDGILSIGGSVGAGLYKFRSKSVNTTGMAVNDPVFAQSQLPVEVEKHEFDEKGGVITYALAGGVNITELIKPDRTSQNSVYLTASLGAQHRGQGKTMSSPGVFGSVGIKGTIGKSSVRPKVKEF